MSQAFTTTTTHLPGCGYHFDKLKKAVTFINNRLYFAIMAKLSKMNFVVLLVEHLIPSGLSAITV